MPYEGKSRDDLIREIDSLKKLLCTRLRNSGSGDISDDDLRTVFEELPVIAFVCDVEPGNKFRVFYAGRLQIAALGLDHIEGRLIDEILKPDDAEKIRGYFSECVSSGKGLEFEARLGEPSEKVFYSKIIPLKNEKGGVFRIIGTIRDISGFTLIRDEYLRQEELNRLLLSRIPDVILLHQEGIIRFVSRSVVDLFGYQPEEVVGKSLYSFLKPSEAERLFMYNRGRSGGETVPDQYDTKVVHKKGHLVDVEIRVSSIEIEGREARLVVITDISERKKAAAVEERFRNLADMLPETVYETDDKGYISYINAAGFDLLGYESADEAPGSMHISDMFPDNVKVTAKNIRRHISENGNIPRAELRVKRKDGTEVPVLIHTVPLFSDGELTGTRGIIIDLSDRKREEEYRIRASKLESLGVLAGGIAHDFNNILTSILGNISLAKMTLPEKHEARDLLSDAEKASFRAKSLTQQMLALAQGGVPVKRSTSIRDLVIECSSFVLRGSAISCDINIPADIPQISVDDGQIFQVMNNLFINAMQAMPEGGTITVDGAVEILPAGNAHYLREGDYIRISVRDTGTGIPKEILEKIYDPYFTTKSSGHGLGLSTAFSIISKHGGNIEVTSEPGNTIFSIFLPLIRGGDLAAPENRGSAGSEKALCILVLEDDDSVRGLLEKLFAKWRYNSFFTADGKTAIDEYASRLEKGCPFDAVLLDLTVPGGMGGRETLAAIARIDPDVRAIASSGYINENLAEEKDISGFKATVSKPFNIDELRRIIEKVVRS
jgi:PAS domain S-box-containing protein